MIVNTGNRTDIPAFYAEWFFNRIQAGFVHVRNPYHSNQIIQYQLDPEVVDVLCFCTKNPRPMLTHLQELSRYRQYWMVSITPYGNDVEPNLNHKRQVMESFKILSDTVGPRCVDWRYDPIFIDDTYSIDFHIHAFEQMAGYLQGYTHRVIISFISLYKKTIKNFPNVQAVDQEVQLDLARQFVAIAEQHDMKVVSCLEGAFLETAGVDISGCMTRTTLENALNIHLDIPDKRPARKGCNCVLENDIGAYNTCGHGCKYCYANYDMKRVRQNQRLHDPTSSLLIGYVTEDDTIVHAKQESYLDRQLRLF